VKEGKEFLVGVVIVAGITVALVGTLWLKGSNWGRPTVRVEVLVQDVAQLSEGNPVKFRGVSIGRVSSIAVEPSGLAVRIVLELDPEVILPASAAVVLGPESLFGSWQVDIVQPEFYPGFPFMDVPAGEVERGVRVLGGYALPELSRLTASAEQISANLAELSARFEVAFSQETADHLARAITNLSDVSEQIRDLVAQQAEIAGSVTARADSALTQIEAASRVARRSFERIEGILTDAQMDSIVINVRLASGNIERIAGGLANSSDDLTRTLARADTAFARIDRITAGIEAGEGSLGRLFADSTLAVRAEGALGQLDLLLQDLRENPRRYIRLSVF